MIPQNLRSHIYNNILNLNRLKISDEEKNKEVLRKHQQGKVIPDKIRECLVAIEDLGLELIEHNYKVIVFLYKGEEVQYQPNSGWFYGKSIKNGRSWINLYNQIKNQ